MKTESSQGSGEDRTTNQVTDSLNPGSTGGEIKYHALILLQLKGKFHLSSSQPLWGQKGTAILPKSSWASQ